VEDIAVDMVVLEYDRYVLVMLYGELDIYTGRDLREQLTCLAGGTDRPVIIDMAGVPFCDGSAQAILLATERRARSQGHSIALIGLTPQIHRVFRLTGLTLVLPVCTTLREAQWCVLPLSDTEIEAALGQGPC
jgi:anti-sigma B factor antagonist